MVSFEEILSIFGSSIIPLARTILIAIALLFVFNILVSFIRKGLLKKARRKKTISNIEIFTRIIRYIFLLIVIVIAAFSYAGEWAGLGLSAGLFTAALGWALQRPITGVAAWLMIVVKRPFEIGDRIIVAGVRGDVTDISLTHIYLGEIGGISNSEEKSGRIIMVPNSILFEQNIINYTQDSDYILDEVVIPVTYDSNLDKVVEIGLGSAEVVLDEFKDHIKDKPYIRTYFQPSGVNVHVRYFTPAKRRQEISSHITREIFNRFRMTKDVRFAYPHTEFVMSEETDGKKLKGNK